MKKITKFSVGLLALSFTCAPLVGCGETGSVGNVEKPVEFLTGEVGETYTLPYWIEENADSVTVLNPANKAVKETLWGYPLEALGKYTVEYVVNGKKQSVALHVVDTKAPGYLPLNINYTIAPDFSL
ncbi:MAG: hypothetical protein IJB97_03555, partial [Clostridia bacterium]|nr:hypothetical protein [Clostridia bacterium]